MAKLHGSRQPTSGAAQKRSAIIPQFPTTTRFVTPQDSTLCGWLVVPDKAHTITRIHRPPEHSYGVALSSGYPLG
ncbi:Helicase-like protein [Corchorus olitorius]|uniref:Helicase-like protein n=1 Tax=Corchorus olitorius TaxID=93759 RepID=A0A1R3JVP0_9ROSI|nr:Helicase-like protein [Corchorus olitorius]